MLSKPDRHRIHDAIAEAEKRTGGELFCIVAPQSGTYREMPFAWAAGAALVLPAVGLLVGLKPGLSGALLPTFSQGGWVAAQAGALQGSAANALAGYASLQALVFVVVLALVWIPAVRRLLTPPPVKRARVHTRAMEQFAHRRHAARHKAGVLIFASLAERRVEIVADEAIHQRAGKAVWDKAVKEATAKLATGHAADGLIAAIGVCGEALAEFCPPQS